VTVQATVTVDSQIWNVALATSPTDIQTGLSGLASIPADTGMLFDLGAGQYDLTINMQEMLFNLDIAFVTEEGYILEVKHDVVAGVDAEFAIIGGPGARYFLEVNAGELVAVESGDIMTIDVESAFDVGMIESLVMFMVIAGMMKMAVRSMR